MDRPELLRIDREAGCYWWRVDGKEMAYPSVTHILETVFRPYRNNNEYALTRGTAVHRAIALLEGFGDGSGLQGGVEGLDERLRPYVDGWLEFKAKAEVEILACETPLLSTEYGFAGTPDLIAKVFGQKAILDIKSGGTAPLVWLQLSGYEIMTGDPGYLLGDDDYKRYALYLPGNGKFKLRNGKEKREGLVFLAALDCYQYMRRRLNG